MEKEQTHTCVDCGTQNCKFKDRTYPPFCPTTHLKEDDRQWALERYDEGKNREIMIASAEVEYEGYCQWTRVQEIMEFARKINAHKIGIANCIGLINEARIFAQILRTNNFEPYSVICKVAGQSKTSMGIPPQCESIGASMCNPILQARLLNEAHTDLNVVIGLCVGHDSLFYKYSEAYVTTLVTKDRRETIRPQLSIPPILTTRRNSSRILPSKEKHSTHFSIRILLPSGTRCELII